MTLSGMTTNNQRTYSTVRVKHVIEGVVCGDMRRINWCFCHVNFELFTVKLNVKVVSAEKLSHCASGHRHVPLTTVCSGFACFFCGVLQVYP